jgi:hypothetical protein
MTSSRKNDGSRLEQLVAFVEEQYLGTGFTVETRKKVYDEAGNQLAELDVWILGPVGSTQFQWLISCRDRPSEGAAPPSWIRELRGTRDELRIDKVTAVSTTGFSAGARTAALEHGIELREVRELTPTEFKTWFHLKGLEQVTPYAIVSDVRIFIDEAEKGALDALQEVLNVANASTRLLVRSTDQEAVRGSDVFVDLAVQRGLFDEVEVDGSPAPTTVTEEYADGEDHFSVMTSAGSVRVRRIELDGHLAVTRSPIAMNSAVEYRKVETGSPISQTIVFMHSVGELNFALEFHRFAKTGETRLLLRPLPNTQRPSDTE